MLFLTFAYCDRCIKILVGNELLWGHLPTDGWTQKSKGSRKRGFVPPPAPPWVRCASGRSRPGFSSCQIFLSVPLKSPSSLFLIGCESWEKGRNWIQQDASHWFWEQEVKRSRGQRQEQWSCVIQFSLIMIKTKSHEKGRKSDFILTLGTGKYGVSAFSLL